MVVALGVTAALTAWAVDGESGPDTTAAPVASASAPTSDAGKFAPPSEADRAFCDVAKNYLARVQAVSVHVTDRGKARELLTGAPAQAQLLGASPAAVRDDVAVLANTLTSLRTGLEAVDYEMGRLSPLALMSLHSPAVIQAMSRVTAWAQPIG